MTDLTSATREHALTMYGFMDGQTTREDGASRASVASICRYWSMESFDNLDGEAQMALRFCLERAADLLSVKAPTPTYPTDDGESLSRIELSARIIDPVSFEKVRQGGEWPDAQWRCDQALGKAKHIATLYEPTTSGSGEVELRALLREAADFIEDEAENRAAAGSEHSDYEREPRDLAERLRQALSTQEDR